MRTSSLLPFGVSEFSFNVTAPEGCKIFYEKAFLVYTETDSVAVLRKKDRTATAYTVPASKKHCRVLLLVGLATDKDSEVEISPDRFVFNIEGNDE